MRRVLSVILFVLGAWLLSSGMMVAWMDLGESLGMQLALVGFMSAFAAPFLLLGTWASPGRRVRELGLTLLISAGIGGSLGLVMMLLANDPGLHKLMPPDQSFAEFKFKPVSGVAVVLIVGALGWLLYRPGRWIPDQARDDG